MLRRFRGSRQKGDFFGQTCKLKMQFSGIDGNRWI